MAGDNVELSTFEQHQLEAFGRVFAEEKKLTAEQLAKAKRDFEDQQKAAAELRREQQQTAEALRLAKAKETQEEREKLAVFDAEDRKKVADGVDPKIAQLAAAGGFHPHILNGVVLITQPSGGAKTVQEQVFSGANIDWGKIGNASSGTLADKSLEPLLSRQNVSASTPLNPLSPLTAQPLADKPKGWDL